MFEIQTTWEQLQEFARKARQGDFSLPGYKYLGPGNRLDKGPPVDHNDWVAYIHDLGYGKIIDRGGNPYLQFSDADEEALKRFKWENFGGKAAITYFEMKKKLWELGIISRIDAKGIKELYAGEKPPATAYKQMSIGGTTRAQRKRLRREEAEKRVQEQVEAGFGEIVDGKYVPYTTEEYEERQEAKRRKTEDDRLAQEKKDAEMREVSVSDKGEVESLRNLPALPEDNPGDFPMGDAGGGAAPAVDTETGAMLSATAGGSGGPPTGAEETPVDFRTREETGCFTETRTAILPVTYYFSMTGPTRSSPVLARLRMNCPYDILVGNTFVNQTEGVARNQGISFDAQPASSTNPTPLATFPTALTGSTAATILTSGGGTVGDDNLYPAWRKWYEKAYESYHTIATDYRITIRNSNTSTSSDIAVYHEWDAYTTSSVGNVIPDTTSQFYWDTWKRINSDKISPKQLANGEDYVEVIEGTWRPGMVMHNVVNSTDIKTWYPTGAAPGGANPIWVEQLVLAIFLGENTPLSTLNAAFGVNVKVELRFHVQFKDLKTGIRYPTATQDDILFTVPDDILQVPNTLGAWL